MTCIHTKNIAKSNDSPCGVISGRFRRRSAWRIITILVVFCSCFASFSCKATVADVTFTLDNSQTVLEVTVPSMVSLNLAPTMGRAFDTQSMDIKVGTNNPTGYTLNLQASSATLTRTGDTGDSVPTIAPMLTTGSATGYTAAQFEAGSSDADTLNRWGYKLSSATNFMPMTTDELVLASTEAAGNANTTTLNFAAKVDTSQPVGTYATTLTFTAVTNVIVTKTYMQNISEATLASLMPNIGDEVMLYDSRDEKGYTVAKLADGNYWMTQNLDLDIDSTKTYTPNDTDVSTDWTPELSTYTTDDMTWEWNYDSPESYDPGDVCWNETWGNWGNENDSWAASTKSCDGDRHYHIGNYYNWAAAVANNDTSSYRVNTLGEDTSICPAGWGLPRAGTGNDTFYGLMNSGNYAFGTTLLADSPLYFVPSGEWIGVVSETGISRYGAYWSAVAFASGSAYYFRVSNDSLEYDPSSWNDLYYGGSVRCVARPLAASLAGLTDIPFGEYCMANNAEYCMQDIDSWKNDLTLEEDVEAMDARDGKTYTVALLADGNVWMTQNLDLDIDSTKTYTPNDTDVSTDWIPELSTYTTDDMTWKGTSFNPESYDPGDVCWPGEAWDILSDACENRHYHSGNYYNWTAAVAMNDSSNYGDDGDNAGQSICPAGWMLPRDSESFYALVSSYGWNIDSHHMEGSYTMWGAPLYFPLLGSYSIGGVQSVGHDGLVWSSSVNGSGTSYDLYFSYNGETVIDGWTGRENGYSVRCIAR